MTTASPPGSFEACPLTAKELALETRNEITRAERVLPAVIARVDDYAPQAPAAVRREAAIRFGGYLLGADFGQVRSEAIGPRSIEYVTNHATAFRNSGAKMLLAAWRSRRA